MFTVGVRRGGSEGLVPIIASVLVGVVALIHVYILVLQMFLWSTPRGRKAFGTTPETAEIMRPLAANQGLYNGFLAVGLVLGLLLEDPAGFKFRLFFLACILVAGLYGGLTVSRRILLVQALPAALALVAVVLAN